jgi:hypothetical protein
VARSNLGRHAGDRVLATTLPTPESSRNLSSLLSYLGLARRTRTFPGPLPSHASTLAALNPSFGLCSKTWDRVILAQNQHLSSALFVILRYTTERQCPVWICAAVLASEFGALSRCDFFGSGGGTSSVPWWAGSPCQASFAALYDIQSSRCAMEVTGD